jgi:hypothetical protein
VFSHAQLYAAFSRMGGRDGVGVLVVDSLHRAAPPTAPPGSAPPHRLPLVVHSLESNPNTAYVFLASRGKCA